MSNKLINLTRLQEFKAASDQKYQDVLTVGSNISISNNVISSTTGGITYSGPLLSGSNSIANNTIVKVGQITLQPGKYILTYTCTFNSNGTGYRQCGFSTNTTDITGFGRNWGYNRNAVNATYTQTSVCGTFEVTNSNGQTFYFLAKQNSGSTLTAYPRAYYLKF